jgi:Fimbrial assembly protein (PilN)
VPAAAPAAAPASSKAADSAANAPPAPSVIQFEVNGRTVDIQAYTRFLRQLEASPWVTDVTPVSAQTVVEKERPITAFTIRATYKQADSAYIRTVPLSQSVR